MTEYEVLFGLTLGEIEAKVNGAFDKGKVCVGGVCVLSTQSASGYYQAVAYL